MGFQFTAISRPPALEPRCERSCRGARRNFLLDSLADSPSQHPPWRPLKGMSRSWCSHLSWRNGNCDKLLRKYWSVGRSQNCRRAFLSCCKSWIEPINSFTLKTVLKVKMKEGNETGFCQRNIQKNNVCFGRFFITENCKHCLQ